jgi:hypothetical protein
MTSTVFTSGTVIVSPWLNDINAAIYTAIANSSGSPPTTTAQVVTNLSQAGGLATQNTAQTLTNKTLTNPTVSTGTFTSPALVTPAIGAATGTSLALTGLATVGTTLGVTGATTLSSTLAVAGLSTFTGAVVVYTPAPASISAVATLTNANLQAQLINTTGVSYTVTMPLGSTLDTLITWAAVDLGFDFSVINTASGTITMAANTGVTTLGGLTIATGVSAQFRIRRTAASTYVMYRIA